MSIIYHGKFEKLKNELDEVKETLDKRYLEIFGKERVDKLRSVAERILTPQSFFDNPKEVGKYLDADMPMDMSNRSFLVSFPSLKSDSSGKVKDEKVKTSFIFYNSEEAFNHSGSKTFTDRDIASYVHEYNHFVWYALQNTPMYLVNSSLQDTLDSEKIPFNIPTYLNQLIKENLSYEEMILKLSLATYFGVITEVFESSNKILDRLVLESIGIDVPLEWRGKERKYLDVPLPTGKIRVPVGGDMFKGLTDMEVIERVLKWETYLSPAMRTPYLNNFLNSIKNLEISRLPINILKKKLNKK